MKQFRNMILLLLCCSLRAAAQPRLVFSEQLGDAGVLSVSREESRKVVFEGRNAGTEPLVFDHAETRCPCAEVQLPQKPVKPGKKVKIRVTFHAKELDDRGVVGNVITLFYRSDSPRGSSRMDYTRIRIRAELKD